MMKYLVLSFFLLFSIGCATQSNIESQDQGRTPIEKLREEQQLFLASESSSESLLRLRRLENKVYETYFARYLSAVRTNQSRLALEYLSICQEIKPDNALLEIEIKRLESKLIVEEELARVEALLSNGLRQQAGNELALLIETHPKVEKFKSLLASIQKEPQESEYMALDLDSVDIKDALSFVVGSFGISPIFDESIKPQAVSLSASSIDFYEAVGYLTQEADLGYTVINETTLLFFQLDKGSLERFSEQYVKTYYLNSVTATDMTSMLKSVMTLKNVSVNDDLNVVVIRASNSEHEIISELIGINDHPKAEVLLEVEILEVNKSKADRLGIEYGNYEIGVQTGTLPLIGDREQALTENGAITIPSISLSAFKQDVDAKTLSNPKIRVLDGKRAKIHIGDQVPLRSSSITESTGQTKTTYEYRDTGIRLEVQPKVYTDNSVEITLQLEISSLGENLGTISDPAFRIGTRVADTSMVLQNGETAMLGGLISENDQDSSTIIPVLGRIPLLKHLFSFADDRRSSTDVLLSITPLVVRPVENNQLQGNTLSIGTEKRLGRSARTGLEGLKLNFVGAVDLSRPEPIIVAGDDLGPEGPTVQTVSPEPVSPTAQSGLKKVFEQKEASPALPASADEPQQTGSPRLMFSAAEYQAAVGEVLALPLKADGLAIQGGYVVEVAFNPAVSRFSKVNADRLSEESYTVEASENRVFIEFKEIEGIGSEDTLLEIEFEAMQVGTSFVIIRPIDLVDAEGNSLNVSIGNTKIKVK